MASERLANRLKVRHLTMMGLGSAIGAGLSFSAVSNTCAMASVLSKMPWNRPAQERTADDVIGHIPAGTAKRS